MSAVANRRKRAQRRYSVNEGVQAVRHELTQAVDNWPRAMLIKVASENGIEHAGTLTDSALRREVSAILTAE